MKGSRQDRERAREAGALRCRGRYGLTQPPSLICMTIPPMEGMRFSSKLSLPWPSTAQGLAIDVVARIADGIGNRLHHGLARRRPDVRSVAEFGFIGLGKGGRAVGGVGDEACWEKGAFDSAAAGIKIFLRSGGVVTNRQSGFDITILVDSAVKSVSVARMLSSPMMSTPAFCMMSRNTLRWRMRI